MSKNKINPELKSGDRVSLILMSDETSLSLGDVGTVISKQKVFGVTQYGIKWDNGSSLSLLSDADYWMLEDEFKEKNNKSLNEDDIHTRNDGRWSAAQIYRVIGYAGRHDLANGKKEAIV